MNERDDDLEARWRRLSNEEPPRALDDAIRAEAHRAVHARPQPARRAWWSTWGAFAAAASVGAIAIGVWQLMPRDIDETRVAVSDATTPSVDLLAKRAETDRAAPASPAFEAKPAAPAPIAPAAAPSVVAPPTTPRIAQMPAPRAAPPASPGAPFARADKFAAAPPAAAGETASRDARSAKALAKTAPTSAAAMSDATGRGSLAAAEPADGIAAPSPSAGGRALDAPVQQLAAAPPMRAKPTVAAPQSVADYIAAIRRARAEHRDADAQAALTKMRAQYADADAQLPPDLRDWAAQVPHRTP
jgi:hypothetical protein